MSRTIAECVILIVITAIAGFAWNAASGKGLTLTRDYFQRVTIPQGAGKQGADKQPKPPTTRAKLVSGNQGVTPDPTDPKEVDIAAAPGDTTPPDGVPVAGTTEPEAPKEKSGTIQGLQAMYLEDAVFYGEPAMRDIVAFVDARTRDNYEEAHIPGAYHLYTYQAEKEIAAIRADLETKEFLIVYCGGGDCEDSVTLASMMINEFGFPYERVWVYEGGLEEWQKHGHPVQTGGSRD